jgi:DDE family transposase
MASITRTLRRINNDLRPYLSEQSITEACHEVGHTWRERMLGPVATVHLFVLQILCFNTAMTHLRHLADAAVKAPAYCRARMRLPLAVLQKLLRQSSTAMRLRDDEQGLWCGLKAYLVDGSSTIAPDTPDSQKAFGQPKGCKKGCGFPVPKVLALFDAFSGMIVELMAFPLYTHEQSKVWMLHALLGVDDLLVGDRGFCSFAHAAMLLERRIHGLFRLHQNMIVDFRPHRHAGGKGRPKSRFIKRLGEHDQIVEWVKPASKPKWMSDEQYEALPRRMQMRELRYRLPCKGQRTLCVTIATTLLDSSRYSKEDIAKLYNVRWTAETHFAELKTTLKMRKVKSMTPEGVKKELAVYCLVYNLVHAIMLQAAARQGVPPDRISFIDTVRWLLSAEPGADMPDLIVNPDRPGRHEPRVTKDRQDTHPKMCRPRNILRKDLKKRANNA